jgi:hypothetical protein
MPQHPKWPPQLTPDGSRFIEVEQDSFDEIKGCGGMVAECLPGELPWDESYGAPSPLGEIDPVLAAAELAAAVTRGEPRGTWVADGDGLDVNRLMALRLILEDAL